MKHWNDVHCLNRLASFPSKHSVQVEKGNKHTTLVGESAVASVFTAPWFSVFTLRGSALQAAAQSPTGLENAKTDNEKLAVQ